VHPPNGLSAYTLKVLDPRSGGWFFTTPELSKLFLDSGKAKAIRTRRVIESLVWIAALPLDAPVQVQDTTVYPPGHDRPMAYSYKWETEDNPQNVWALAKLRNSTRDIFMAVVIDCITEHHDQGSYLQTDHLELRRSPSRFHLQ
jgi:hypothetical protein